MAYIIGLPQNAPGQDVADMFLQGVWKLHGWPTEIILDMDAKFSGEFVESLCNMPGVNRCRSTAYHPQTDRHTETTNQLLEGY